MTEYVLVPKDPPRDWLKRDRDLYRAMIAEVERKLKAEDRKCPFCKTLFAPMS